MDDREAGYSLKVADVHCGDAVGEMQCRCPDQQILECQADTLCFLLAFNAPCEARDFDRHWIDGNIGSRSMNSKRRVC